MKKCVALVLTLVLVLPLLLTTALAETIVEASGWVVPETPLKLEVFAGQSDPEKVNGYLEKLLAWVKEDFNVDITYSVFDIEMDQKLNLMLASNDYPAVIKNLSAAQVSRFAQMGKVVDLAPYMDTAGANIKADLNKWGVYETFFDAENHLYALPTMYGYVNEPDLTGYLRYDWWQEMGEPAYGTPEEYYELLKAMLALHPTNANGEKAYAISAYEMSGGGTRMLLQTLAGMWGLSLLYDVTEDGTFTYWTNTPAGFELTQYMNRFYQEGLMDPDAFINTYDDWRAKFSTERIMGGFGDWWRCWNAGHEVWQQLDPDWKEDQRFVQIGLKAPGAEKSLMTAKSARGWETFTIITDKAENPEEILRWIDFTTTDVGKWITGYGLPGTENALWEMKDGAPIFSEGPMNRLLTDKFDWEVDMRGNGAQFLTLCNSLEGVRGNNTSYYYDHSFTDLMPWWRIMIENCSDTVYDATLQRMISIDPTSDLGMKSERVNDAIISLWAKCVMSESDDELAANYQALADKVNELGIQDIEKFFTESYQALMLAE